MAARAAPRRCFASWCFNSQNVFAQVCDDSNLCGHRSQCEHRSLCNHAPYGLQWKMPYWVPHGIPYGMPHGMPYIMTFKMPGRMPRRMSYWMAYGRQHVSWTCGSHTQFLRTRCKAQLGRRRALSRGMRTWNPMRIPIPCAPRRASRAAALYFLLF